MVATGNSGTEIRNSFMVNYDDGKTGFSLGTTFWSGMTGGIMSSIDGGDFGSGFYAGAVSSLVSSGVQNLGISGGQTNKFGQSDWYNAATIAAGGLSGGLSSTIAGGKFWAGARQGLITSGLNHVAHKIAPDNGYEPDGEGGYRKINDYGGDEIDYLYENGQIVDLTFVHRQKIYSEFPVNDTYGVRKLNKGGGLIDPTGGIVYGYVLGGVGGKALGLAWKGFVRYTGGSKQWFRLGSSYSYSLGSRTYLSLRWRAGGNHWQKIGNPFLQSLNQSFRTFKLPISSWRSADPGHFHIFHKSPFKF